VLFINPVIAGLTRKLMGEFVDEAMGKVIQRPALLFPLSA